MKSVMKQLMSRYRNQTVHNYPFYILLAIIVISMLCSAIATQFFDGDDYWILAVGREIVETKSVPHINTMTAIPNMHLVVQQWAWDVLCYLGYMLAGNIALLWITCINVCLMVFLLFRYFRLTHMDPITKNMLILIGLLIANPFFSGRPNILTMNLLLWQVICQQKYTSDGEWKHLAPLIPITVLEINFHASMWIFHLLFLLPLYFPVISILPVKLKKRTYSIKYPIIFSGLMVGTAFLNPYGYENVIYVFRSYSLELINFGVLEMERPSLISFQSILLIACVIGMIVFCYTRKGREVEPEQVYLMTGCMILTALCERNQMFLFFVVLILARMVLWNTDALEFHKFVNKQIKPVIILAVLACGFTIFHAISSGIYVETDQLYSPVAAAAYLEEHAEEGDSVFATYNAASYIEWVGYTVFIDARAEIYLEEVNGSIDALGIYKKLMDGPTLADYQNLKNEYDFSYYLVETGSHMDNFLECDSEIYLALESETGGYRLYKKATFT